MSFYFELGKSSASGIQKSAGIGRALGDVADVGISAAKPAAKFLARLAGRGLTTPGATGATALGLGLMGTAGNEMLGAAASRTGLPIPHFLQNDKQPLWAPHQTPALIDPKITGWKALGHAFTRPIQTASHMLGYGPDLNNPLMNTTLYDPHKGTVNLTQQMIDSGDVSIDPKTRKFKVAPQYAAPGVKQRYQNHLREEQDLKRLGFPVGGGGSDRSDFDPDQPRHLTLDDFPFR